MRITGQRAGMRSERGQGTARNPHEIANFCKGVIFCLAQIVFIYERDKSSRREVDVNRCAARGCGRWTRAGEDFCRRHRSDEDTRSDATPRDGKGGDGLATFRARVAAGDYEAVLGRGLRDTLRGAAADSGLEAEIGALRLALARLLDEEADASRLAAGVARVAGVAVQAARLRQGRDNEAEKISVYLQRELAAIEAERTTTRRQEMNHDDANG
jgi:hypothetical protein